MIVIAISLPTSTISSSLKPLEVEAGVPILIPLVTNGLFVSNGIAFLFTVIPTSSSIFSASLPVTPVSVRFTSIRWLSVPPLTSLKPSAISVSARTDAFLTTCSAYVLKLGSSASLKHTALAAIVCIRGPP